MILKSQIEMIINSCEFHERVFGLQGIMLFDPKDIQQLNSEIYE